MVNTKTKIASLQTTKSYHNPIRRRPQMCGDQCEWFILGVEQKNAEVQYEYRNMRNSVGIIGQSKSKDNVKH